MPRITRPLTDTEIRQAKPRDKEYNLADGNGLMLRVKPNGSKLWLFNYLKPFTKRRANLSLGPYPTITLARARSLRDENRELLSRDIDPAAHRIEQKRLMGEAHENTLERVASKWFEIKKARVSQSYGDDIFRSLELHIFPRLGKMPIHLIRAPHAIEVLEPISAKGALETVKRLCQRLNEIMVFATNRGLIDANPLSGIGKAFEAPRKNHMPTLRPDQLPELMATLANASVKRTTRCLIEWQLQTLTRPGEAAGTKWDEIDIDRGLWTIPATRMKKRRPHIVPLTKQAIGLLKFITPISGHREFVFPSDRNPRTHAHFQTANMALKRMGYANTLVAHGLRALGSTILNEEGFDPDIIEAALAHTDNNSVRAAYNRAEYLARRREMMEWWSNHIEKAASGSFSLASLDRS